MRLGCMCSFIHVLPTWQLLIEPVPGGAGWPWRGRVTLARQVALAGWKELKSSVQVWASPPHSWGSQVSLITTLASVLEAENWGYCCLPWMSK